MNKDEMLAAIIDIRGELQTLKPHLDALGRDAKRFGFLLGHMTIGEFCSMLDIPLPSDPALRDMSDWVRAQIDAAMELEQS